MTGRVVSLHIYPIKSCAGIDVTQLTIGAGGPLWDREWMIVATKDHHFVTQRSHPQMALITTRLTASTLVIGVPQTDGAVREMQVPLAADAQAASFEVQVWNDQCLATEPDPDVSAALSTFLQKSVRLVRMHPNFHRGIKEQFAQPDARVGFADQMPILLASLESLNDLNARLAEPVPVNRFRANIVVEGMPHAFAEDDLRGFRIGAIGFKRLKPCSRCPIVATDQATAVRSKEPLATLAKYRRNSAGRILFGQYIVALGEGDLHQGALIG